jgi:hypothetical protein
LPVSFFTTSGVDATRVSPGRVSLGTPILIGSAGSSGCWVGRGAAIIQAPL